MKHIVIGKKPFNTIVNNLIKGMKVYAPAHKDKGVDFMKISSPEEIVYNYTYSILPPKKILFPPKETLFTFNTKGTDYKSDIDHSPQAILGVHPCDIHGISLLDKVFLTDNVDPYYKAKRDNTIIIGIECTPDDECFCASLNTDIPSHGFDLFLNPNSEEFIITVGSKKGEEIINAVENREAGPIDMEYIRNAREDKKNHIKKCIKADYRSLPLYYAGAFNLDHIWGKYADRCFSCGSCIMTCPTCYCFDVVDNVELDLSTGKRERIWDGCMLKDFAVIAGGENFRKNKLDRLKHRFNRKFQFHMLKFGKLFCIGCGRCSRACLAEIKPPDVTNDIIEAKGDA